MRGTGQWTKETGGAALADVEKGPGLTCRVLLHLTAQHSAVRVSALSQCHTPPS